MDIVHPQGDFETPCKSAPGEGSSWREVLILLKAIRGFLKAMRVRAYVAYMVHAACTNLGKSHDQERRWMCYQTIPIQSFPVSKDLSYDWLLLDEYLAHTSVLE